MIIDDHQDCVSIVLFDLKNFSGTDTDLVAQLQSSGATDGDIERILKYANRKDRMRTAAAELIVRRNISHHVPSLHIIRTCPTTNSPTKPYLVSTNLNLVNFPIPQFNITHDCDIIAVAFSAPSVSVGIDVMKIAIPTSYDTPQDFFAIMKNVFTEREWQYINSSLRRFFHLWTAKETFLKCIGTGLYTEPGSVEIRMIDSFSKGVGEARITGMDKFFVKIFDELVSGYIVSVCVGRLADCDQKWTSLLPPMPSSLCEKNSPESSLSNIQFRFIHLDEL
jgi:phosphopantetheine--protein transferase-like protein